MAADVFVWKGEFTKEERESILAALGLATQSCVRLSNRAGQPIGVRDEYLRQAERIRAIASKLTLTK